MFLIRLVITPTVAPGCAAAALRWWLDGSATASTIDPYSDT
jgi:hypothetical protein